jgi:hypothetical protein
MPPMRRSARLVLAVASMAVLASGPVTPVAARSKRWVPSPRSSFQYQLSGAIDVSVPAKVFDIDAFDASKQTVARLHARGKRVVCYVDAGSWESYRPDADRYPAEILGGVVDGWPDERWVDIRRLDILKPIIRDRVDLCAAKGFDAVEFDWTDSYLADTGFPLTRADQLAFDRWLAWVAHDRGLSVGLKNSLPLVRSLVGRFDFVITEQCFQYRECAGYRPFLAAGKAHFDVEYQLERREFCPAAVARGISASRKRLSLSAWRRPC